MNKHKPKRLILLAALAFAALALPRPACAQDTDPLLDRQPYDYTQPHEGPNSLQHWHLFLNGGFFLDGMEGQDVELRSLGAGLFTFGIRYKLQPVRWFALGLGLNYRASVFELKREGNYFTPAGLPPTRSESMNFHNGGAEAFLRLTFGRRGNVMGKFLDLGGYLDGVLEAHLYVADDPLPGVGRVSVRESRLDYTSGSEHGLRARLGFNRYVLSASYRLSDLLQHPELDAEFPRLSLALEVGLHR